MAYTPMERKKKLMELIKLDEDCAKITLEMDSAAADFQACTDKLSKKRGRMLWAYPTLMHVLHSRVLELVCENMRFAEE